MRVAERMHGYVVFCAQLSAGILLSFKHGSGNMAAVLLPGEYDSRQGCQRVQKMATGL